MPPAPENVVSLVLGRLRLRLPCTLKATAAYALQTQLELSPTFTQPKADGGLYYHFDPLTCGFTSASSFHPSASLLNKTNIVMINIYL